MNDGVLLDTVAFVEYLQGSLPARIRQLIDQAERRYLSVVTPWEIQMKKVLRDRIRPLDIKMAMEQMGLELRTILLDHLWFLWQMPQFEDHKDPFDRLMIAQACSDNLTIVTRDRRFALYSRLSLIEY